MVNSVPRVHNFCGCGNAIFSWIKSSNCNYIGLLVELFDLTEFNRFLACLLVHLILLFFDRSFCSMFERKIGISSQNDTFLRTGVFPWRCQTWSRSFLSSPDTLPSRPGVWLSHLCSYCWKPHSSWFLAPVSQSPASPLPGLLPHFTWSPAPFLLSGLLDIWKCHIFPAPIKRQFDQIQNLKGKLFLAVTLKSLSYYLFALRFVLEKHDAVLIHS